LVTKPVNFGPMYYARLAVLRRRRRLVAARISARLGRSRLAARGGRLARSYCFG
jgi:hypothetical protein